MHLDASIEYLASGGNRYPSCADWDAVTGTIAYGSGRNIALWQCQDGVTKGIAGLLRGHAGPVTAVKFLYAEQGAVPFILSGSADHSVQVWKSNEESLEHSTAKFTLTDHKGSINCLATLYKAGLFASGSADGTVKIWRILPANDDVQVVLLQSLETNPSLIPLTLAVGALPLSNALILAVAGTRNTIQVYSSVFSDTKVEFMAQAVLPGHEAWIRALEFKQASTDTKDLMLASASQDKYIRLWKIAQRARLEPDMKTSGASVNSKDALLTNKNHTIEVADVTYDVTFEALLLGHEDWIYTIRWNMVQNTPQLLSASADNSLVIWEPEEASGIWVCKTRLGELSALKGSTTATGSAGGLWIGLWTNDGREIVALGRTGSWRRWLHNEDTDEWTQKTGVSGHTGEARDLSWSVDGKYLLSTSADQTTRAHFMRQDENGAILWHEYARPQIHGYDLNCIGSTSKSQFVSGADEKLIRVFDAPKPFMATLRGEAAVEYAETASSDPEAFTSVPVLGLSNKAVSAEEDVDRFAEPSENGDIARPESGGKVTAAPPLEDQLARKTLWPEREKLYGHGFEISTLAVSTNGDLVATACKASSLEHAVIRIYDRKTWRAINPPLTAHSLTVTGLEFSSDGKLLLSVGRDRQWTVFELSENEISKFVVKASNPRSHSRMVLDCAWVPGKQSQAFGTAGRDKFCKIWCLDGDTYTCKVEVPTSAAATSIAFCTNGSEQCIMAVGTETGSIILYAMRMLDFSIMGTFECDQSVSGFVHN